MTPKARREQQHTREMAARTETEAGIELFKAGRPVHRPTELISRRRTAKHSARCYGCDARGFPLQVWEYAEVASGPAILCRACATIAERGLSGPRRTGPPPAGAGRPVRRRE
jgi:hypothetical protein